MTNQESCKARSALNIAIIIPCYNESESIGELIRQLNIQFNDVPNHFSYHFLLVNDGSTDKTWKLIEYHSSQNKSRVSGICLSRNFGHQKALLAGIEYASKFADYTICMDADLQHPIAVAKEMLDVAINNEKNIVLGQRNVDQHSTLFKRVTSKSFYKTLNLLGAEISPNVSDFRVMDKQSTLAMIDHGDNTFFSRGIISLNWIQSTNL
jgi:polyisoprenyl-phosphate glycosyltransferase